MQPSKRAQTAIFFTVLVDLLGFGIVIPLLPIYAKTLASHPSDWMVWVNNALGLQTPGAFWAGTAFVSFSVMQFVATPLLGRLSDLVGRRPVLWVSLLGSALGYLVLAFTGRFEWVLAARIVDGITGGNISVAQAAMADVTPAKDRSKAMGLIGAAFGLGFVLGPFLGGTLAASHLGRWFVSAHGWHLPFLVAAGLSMMASLMVIAWLPETLNIEDRKAARQEETRGHALRIALKRQGMPQILAISLLAMTGFAMMEGTYSLLVNQRFSFGEREVGYLFGIIGILIVIYQGGLVRFVAKRLPERRALMVGLLLMVVAMPLLPSASWKWPFLLVMVPLAWGSGMNNTAVSALASQLTPAADQGGLFGVLNAVSGIGRILGPGLGTWVFARWGYQKSYFVATGIL
ncbi:MAG: MFS transporter, partial [Firmicutes bacterium]|nr:MFS transporter [Bacillota bacterium]